MRLKRLLLAFMAPLIAMGIVGCTNDQARQDGPLSFGAPDGQIENTFCGIHSDGNETSGISDIAANKSESPLWITSVKAVGTDQWEAKRALASLLPAGNSSLYGWVSEDLKDPNIRKIVDSLESLHDPLEVPPKENVLVALEGAAQMDTGTAKISQLEVSYKTDPKSAQNYTVLGNISYVWKTSSCE